MAGAMQLNNWLLIIPPVIFLIILLFVFVYFFIRLSLSGVVCIIDKLGPVGALKQSRRVIKPFVTPVVGAGGLFILFALLSYVPFTAVSAAFKNANPTHMSLWGVGYMFLANILLAPTCAIIFVILYHKLKEPI
ncbi:MAG: hypothetical protein A3K83_02750 [Omnitrophica WOR_2 bacterium RBG_13_44_8b]|nr:MAG: hypothetical protein A3K83_02750 [Omnitrophica WOR_2 bacterium RBG_13_44_8b]